MRLEMRLEQRLEARLDLVCEDAATISIFPEVEKWLNKDSDRQRALDHVRGRKNMDRYRCVIDFLFTEIHTWYRPKCQAFYSGKAPPLRDISDPKHVVLWSETMIRFLEIAYEAHNEQRRLSWGACVKLARMAA